jgi:hypothetical protein
MQVHQIVPEPELLVPPDAAKVEELLLLAKLTASGRIECGHGEAVRALVRAPSMCMPTAADGFWAECMEQAAIQPRGRRLGKAGHEERGQNRSAVRGRERVEASHLLEWTRRYVLLNIARRGRPVIAILSAASVIDEAGD